MLQEHYIDPVDFCSAIVTNKLLTLGMDTEMLYYEENSGLYLFPLWQAQKWLREEHHINIRVSYIAYHKVWFADWLNLDSGKFDDTDATFATYEEALADGIVVVLESIKKEE